jgi:RNA polymerase sigma-70 factor (ECF subfamily)
MGGPGSAFAKPLEFLFRDQFTSRTMSSADSTPLQAHTLRVQALFVQHQSKLRAFLHSLVPDFAAADDLLQECFLTVSEKAREFSLDSNFLAWARSIARFKVLALHRDSARNPVLLSEEVMESLILSAPAEDGESPSDERQALVVLRGCLGKLAPAAREIVRMRYFSQWGPVEISRIRDCSPNAVNVTLARSRDVLRRCMETNFQPTAL